jgi:hypothetical protein
VRNRPRQRVREEKEGGRGGSIPHCGAQGPFGGGNDTTTAWINSGDTKIARRMASEHGQSELGVGRGIGARFEPRASG